MQFLDQQFLRLMILRLFSTTVHSNSSRCMKRQTSQLNDINCPKIAALMSFSEQL